MVDMSARMEMAFASAERLGRELRVVIAVWQADALREVM